jgi:hypothetical protein
MLRASAELPASWARRPRFSQAKYRAENTVIVLHAFQYISLIAFRVIDTLTIPPPPANAHFIFDRR